MSKKIKSKRTKYLLGILATWVIGGLLYMTFCCKCKNENCVETNPPGQTETNTAQISSSKANGFFVSGTDFNFKTSDNFKFLKEDNNIILPISDSINLGIDKIKNYLESTKQKLKITGHALSSEKNTSIYENLGLARAAEVKKYFTDRGVLASQIETFGKINDDLSLNGNVIINSPVFEFINSDQTETKIDYASLKAKINADPITMYFKTGESSINLSETDRKKIAEILDYLENVPDSKISIVGHTDNVGKRETNVKLGLDRANFALNYFVENAISKNQIDVTSKGPDEPVADNKNAEGRNTNRRVVVSIK